MKYLLSEVLQGYSHVRSQTHRTVIYKALFFPSYTWVFKLAQQLGTQLME